MSTVTAAPDLSIRFRRQGAMIMCFVAFPWAATGIGFLGEGAGYWVALAAAVAITAAVAVYAVRFRPEHTRERTVPVNWMLRYNLALGAELVFIAATVASLIALGVAPLIPAVVCLVVGVHFFPLATAFDQPQYRLTGAALSAVAVLGAVLFAVADPQWCGAVAGVGAAVTLWWTSLSVTRAG